MSKKSQSRETGTGTVGTEGTEVVTEGVKVVDEGSTVAEATEKAKSRDKAEAFRKLASQRTSQAIEAIRRITSLANKGNYTYTAEQVEKMLGALSAEVEALRKAFAEGKASSGTFEL